MTMAQKCINNINVRTGSGLIKTYVSERRQMPGQFTAGSGYFPVKHDLVVEFYLNKPYPSDRMNPRFVVVLRMWTKKSLWINLWFSNMTIIFPYLKSIFLYQ